MKKFLWLLLLTLPAIGQVINPSIISVSTAPSGACNAGLPNQQVVSTGVQYSCQNGTWAALGGGGATFPTATGAGQVLTSSGAGSTYTAQIPATTPITTLCSFATSNSGTANSSCLSTALASGNAISIPCAGSPYPIGSPVVISGGQTLIGQNDQCVVLQPPTNTVGLDLYGANNNIQNLTIAYASAEPIGNTSSIGVQMGDSSGGYLYYSYLANIFVQNANASFATPASSGEFQNTFVGMRALKFSKYGIYDVAGTSGSVWENTRIQNENSTPTTSDNTNGLVFTNAFNTVMNTTNIEYLDSTNAVIALNQSSVTFNGLHLEQLLQPDYTQVISVNYQNYVSINNFSIQNSTINDAHGQIFNIYSSASAGGSNTLFIDGFVELGNTFTGNLPLYGSDGNYNRVYVRGISGRNSGHVVLTTRTDLVQYEGILTATPGGSIIAGLTGTSAPTGTMGAPFSGVNYQVGDVVDNTAVTAITNPGWICTTSSATPTFTLLPNSGTFASSYSPGASQQVLSLAGTPYTAGTATTDFPLAYFNTSGATAVTSFNTSGTYLGVNAANAFNGRFLDFHVNGGSSLFFVDAAGDISTNTAFLNNISSAYAPGASQTMFSATGAPYASGTSTTNFPLQYFNTTGATAPTTFSTGGTFIGANAASGFAGNFLDFHLNGSASLFSVNSKGNVVLSSTSVPTMAAGAAAGTSPTCTTVTGNNNSMTLTCTTGTATPTTGTLATVTFNGTLSSAPNSCNLQARNAATALAAADVYTSAPTTGGFTISVAGTALTVSTPYSWGVHCL